MNYNYIINPITNRKVSIYNKIGKEVFYKANVQNIVEKISKDYPNIEHINFRHWRTLNILMKHTEIL